MKVILLADIPKIGNRYDVKDLSQGYAQNVLLSKGLAELATPQALAKLDAKKAAMAKKKEEEEKVFDSLISSVDGSTVTITMKANEKGHLFKAVSARDVAQAIQKDAGVTVEESAITIGQIKEVGSHSVTIKKGNKVGKCTVVITKE